MNDIAIIEIQDETTAEQLRNALPDFVNLEHLGNNEYEATVAEARDAEEEITNLLNKAGINAFVYEAWL